MKPSDVFLGVIDFFSTFIPGAVAGFLLLNQDLIPLPRGWPLVWGTLEARAVFVVAAYLLGHALSAMGSRLLDFPVYDAIYRRWKRTAPEPQSTVQSQQPTWRQRMWWLVGPATRFLVHLRKFWATPQPADPLSEASQVLQRLQLRDLLHGTTIEAHKVSGAIQWAWTFVRLKSPQLVAELDALQAQSKLFRGLAMVVLASVAWWPNLSKTYWVLAAFGLVLSVARYCKLRWDATQRTYQYFIALALPTNTAADVSRLAYSYWEMRGGQCGAADTDWLKAEKELKSTKVSKSA